MRAERNETQAVRRRGPGRGALGSKPAGLRLLKTLLAKKLLV
jgi:hypothetical protein